jgi:NAD(P)-dependent dehydrogenase (short-subunit alcohol dehydrogenase family)
MTTGVLDGKVAIVTGAAGGIGEVYARGLAQAGAAVVLADLDEARATAAAEKIAADGLAASAVGVDITDPTAVERMVAAAVSSHGGLDIMVNNAALMAELPRLPLADYPMDWFDKLMAVNVRGTLLCCQAAATAMKARGGGSIINQSSAGAFALSGAYSVSKLAIVGMTIVLAKDLGQYGIRVNAIAPGIVDSEAGRKASTDALKERIGAIAPLHAVGQPEELLGALLFLASGASEWVTGQTLNVDGGWIMRV